MIYYKIVFLSTLMYKSVILIFCNFKSSFDIFYIIIVQNALFANRTKRSSL